MCWFADWVSLLSARCKYKMSFNKLEKCIKIHYFICKQTLYEYENSKMWNVKNMKVKIASGWLEYLCLYLKELGSLVFEINSSIVEW
jgi:hypothetical protein